MSKETNDLRAEIERLKIIIHLLAEKLRIINSYIADDIIMDSKGNIQIIANSKIIIGGKEFGSSNAQTRMGGKEFGNSNVQTGIGGKEFGNSNAQTGIGGKEFGNSNAQIGIGEKEFGNSNAQPDIEGKENFLSIKNYNNREKVSLINNIISEERIKEEKITTYCNQIGVQTLLEAVLQNKILSSEFNVAILKKGLKKNMNKSNSPSLEYTAKIVLGLYDNPHRHYNELRKLCGLTESGLYKQIKLLKDKGIISRIKFQVYHLTSFTNLALANSFDKY